MTAPLQYGAPQASDPTKVMGRRTLAWIADLLLFLVVAALGFASMGEYVDVPVAVEDPCQELEDQAAARGETLGACLDFRDMGIEEAEDRIYLLDGSESGLQTGLSLGWFALFVIVQGLTGGSPGKLLFGLRVVDQYGTRIGIGKSLGRTLMWVVDAAPWFIPLVGPIAAFTSNGHRRVGDLAAGTYVVASSSVGQPVMTASAPIPAGQTAWGATPPTGPPPMGQGWSSPSAPPPPGSVPGWSRTSDVAATPPPTVPDTTDAPGTSEGHGGAAPVWDAPTLPEVDDPTAGWEPPTSPSDDWNDPTQEERPTRPAAPFAAPGADGPPLGPSASVSAAEPPPAPRYELPPPQWDPARGTYLQWEPNEQVWLQWDTAAERWKPIDT